MARLTVDQPAPPFALPDYAGRLVSLSDYRGSQVVLLVFNRSFG